MQLASIRGVSTGSISMVFSSLYRRPSDATMETTTKMLFEYQDAPKNGSIARTNMPKPYRRLEDPPNPVSTAHPDRVCVPTFQTIPGVGRSIRGRYVPFVFLLSLLLKPMRICHIYVYDEATHRLMSFRWRMVCDSDCASSPQT